MRGKGAISKICYCSDDITGRRLGAKCQKLKRANGSWSSTHGVWVFQLELPRTADGKRRTLRRVPTNDPTSHDEAVADLNQARELMRLAGGEPDLADEIATVLMGCKRGKPLPDRQRLARTLRSGVPNATSTTLGEYLTWWIANRQIDEHTKIGYGSHIRVHLVPQLGHHALQALNATHIEMMFARMKIRNAEVLAARDSDEEAVRNSVKGERLTMPATMTRIKATLRKALNDAVEKHRLIDFNPALHAETPTYDRPEVRVWTPRAITQWQTSGFIPSPVMVWTPQQAGQFLDHTQVHDPDLYALFELVMVGGPRRGEAVGVRADQTDFDDEVVYFTHQLTTHGHQPVYKKVKTRNGDRAIHIDHATCLDLQAYWRLRQSWEQAAGDRWPRTVPVRVPVPGGYTTVGVDLLFRQPDGRAWHPGTVTARFKAAAEAAGLPPIRFHDGRHAAATYTKAAGGDLLDLRKKLGHASVTVTADHYPAQLDELDRALAERTAALIPRQRPNSTDPAVSTPTAPASGSTRSPILAKSNNPPKADAKSPIPESSRGGVQPRNDHRIADNQLVSQRAAGATPVVFLAPTSPPWPPAGRRRDRYPRDLN